MTTELSTAVEPGRSLQVRPLLPTTIDEAWRLAKSFAMAQMLPKSYGSGDIELMSAKAFTAMQLGAEVGMSPMQSIQSIAVVNGMPTIWGDAQLALVLSHHTCEDVEETYTGMPYDDNFKAVCTAKRKGRKPVTAEFSVADAKEAQLWSKSGTWQTHKKRMLRYKARAFALRDTFPDVLKGLTHSTEEMQGEMLDVTPQNYTGTSSASTTPNRKMSTMNDILKEQPPVDKPVNTPNVPNAAKDRADKIIETIKAAQSESELKTIVNTNSSHIIMMPATLSLDITEAVDKQKIKLGIAPENDLFKQN